MIPLAHILTVVEPLVLSGSDITFRLFLVLILIALNAFFVAAEFSIVSVRQSRINQLASAGDVQAKTVQDLQRSIERLLSTAQIGITISVLLLGWIGEDTMTVLLRYWMQFAPFPGLVTRYFTELVAVLGAFFIVAYLQIVMGELCPKSVALLYPEQLARFLGPPSLAIARLFTPLIWALNLSTRLLLRLAGIQYSGQGWYSRVTPEELQLIIQTSSASPGLDEEERELLSNVLEFADVTVREVMVPRISISSIAAEATFRELLHEVAESGHSRYPVIGESLDEVQGIIYFKELADPWVRGEIANDGAISPWVRPTQFVPENLPLNDLLQLMQQTGQSLVMVADEFGGTAGLVTLKDLASEIIGYSNEPEDEEEEPMVQYLDDNTILIQAQMNLEEVNELLDLELPVADDYQTLGGFMIHQLQKIPIEGDRLRYDMVELTVVSVSGPRLHQIRVERLETPYIDEGDGITEAGAIIPAETLDSLNVYTPPNDDGLSDSSSPHSD
ncbi:hemolysin family protein [Leptolyngbya sp. AN02str]|uniref:hemolysin family protein n=1 Tax=Leptolyngbya sp. AN02str TaxID=3423363 RepID=UPI003D314AC9